MGELVAPVLGLAVLDAISGHADASADADADNDSASTHAEANADAEASRHPDGSCSPSIVREGERLLGDSPAWLIGDVVDMTDIPINDEITGHDSIPQHVKSLVETAIDTTASVTNNAIDGFSLIEGAADEAGNPVSQTVRATTGLAEAVGVGQLGGCNLLSAVAEAPAAVLDGRPLEAVHDLLWEAEKAVEAGGNALNQIIDALNPVAADVVQQAADVVGDLVGSLQTGPLLDSDLIDLDGSGPAGNLLGAVVNPNSGALLQLDAAGDGRPSQSSNLIDVGLGPRDQHQGTVDVLNPVPGGNAGALELNVLDVGSDGPRLIDADLLTDEDAIDFGALPAIADAPALVNPIALDNDCAIVDITPTSDLPDIMRELASHLMPTIVSQNPLELNV